MAKAHQSLMRRVNVTSASMISDEKMMISTHLDESQLVDFLRMEGIEVYETKTIKVRTESATDYVKRMSYQCAWINKLAPDELSELYDIAINAKNAGVIEGIYSV
jgi:hypothetical protein